MKKKVRIIVLDRKEEGNVVGTFFIVVISLIAVAVLLMYSVFQTATIDKSNKIDNIAYNYVLGMQAYGYLNATMETSLKTSLQDMGMENIVIQPDTSKSESDYGSEIVLHFSGTIKADTYAADANLQLAQSTDTIPVDRIYRTTNLGSHCTYGD